jgi:hypothetical protein
MADVLAENPNAQQLYETRKLLSSKLSGPAMPGDETAAIVKGANRETAAMIEAIDSRLDEATDGVWGNYMKLYKDMSKPLNNARALDDIYKAIDSPKAPLVGNSPEVTRRSLTAAVDKFGKSDRYGNRLDAKATRELGDISEHLRRGEEVQRTMKKAGTSGGGSNTAMDTVGQEAQDAAGSAVGNLTGVPLLGTAINATRRVLDVQGKRELSELLRDPARTAAAIRLQLQNERPLSPAQQIFLTTVSRAPIAAPAAMQSE